MVDEDWLVAKGYRPVGRRTVWIPWALRPLFFTLKLLPQFVWRRMPR